MPYHKTQGVNHPLPEARPLTGVTPKYRRSVTVKLAIPKKCMVRIKDLANVNAYSVEKQIRSLILIGLDC